MRLREFMTLIVLAAAALLFVLAGVLFSLALKTVTLATPQVVQVREPVYLPAVTLIQVERIVTATPGPTPTPGPTATQAPTQTPYVEVWFVPVETMYTPTPTATIAPRLQLWKPVIVCGGGG